MSNPEKIKMEENQDSEATLSDDDVYMREIVLGLPALTVSERLSVSNVVEVEEEKRLNEQAVVAAELVMAAAETAVMKGKKKVSRRRKTSKTNDEACGSSKVGTEEEEEARLNEQAVVAAELVMAAAEEAVTKGKKKKKVNRRRRTSKTDEEACGSSKVETKKPRKRSSELTNPPKGPPICNICGRHFGSWKAVFGHLRSHKDRNYQGFLPPPKFSATAEGFSIPGQNSAFVVFTAGGGSSGGVVRGDEGGRGLGFDLNVNPVEEDDHEVTESETLAKFDLNKPPPKDEEKEDKAK